MGTKRCLKCRTEKLLFYFSKNNKRNGEYYSRGIHNWCKLCEEKWREDNITGYSKNRKVNKPSEWVDMEA